MGFTATFIQQAVAVAAPLVVLKVEALDLGAILGQAAVMEFLVQNNSSDIQQLCPREDISSMESSWGRLVWLLARQNASHLVRSVDSSTMGGLEKHGARL